jgi:hypothetical protein
MSRYYTIIDAHGTQITTGLPPHTAHATAQQLADKRCEAVLLYACEGDDCDDGEIIQPTVIGTVAWQKGVQDALDVLAARLTAAPFLDPAVLPGLHDACAAVQRLFERDRIVPAPHADALDDATPCTCPEATCTGACLGWVARTAQEVSS